MLLFFFYYYFTVHAVAALHSLGER